MLIKIIQRLQQKKVMVSVSILFHNNRLLNAKILIETMIKIEISPIDRTLFNRKL